MPKHHAIVLSIKSVERFPVQTREEVSEVRPVETGPGRAGGGFSFLKRNNEGSIMKKFAILGISAATLA
jgi:hypothetical protein